MLESARATGAAFDEIYSNGAAAAAGDAAARLCCDSNILQPGQPTIDISIVPTEVRRIANHDPGGQAAARGAPRLL